MLDSQRGNFVYGNGRSNLDYDSDDEPLLPSSYDSDDEEEDYDERRNSFEAFGEWFNKEVRFLEDIERNGEDFDEVITEWCKNNNHQIREDGIYNMNIANKNNIHNSQYYKKLKGILSKFEIATNKKR